MFNPCSFCDARCCKSHTITTTIFDILRVCKATGKHHQEFSVLHELRLLAYDPDMVLDTEDGYRQYLLGFKSHPCVFLLNNHLCSIYSDAPLSCRYYPYTISGSLNARFCPLLPNIFFRFIGPGISKDKLLKELAAHKKLVKEWNKNPEKKEECVAFLLRNAIRTH